MELPDRDQQTKHRKRQIRQTFFIRMLLVAFLLIVTISIVLGFAVSRYKRDYYNNALRACDFIAGNITEHSKQYPHEDVMRHYVPEMVNEVTGELSFFLYFFDEEGQCILCSRNTGQQADELSLSSEMLQVVQQDGMYLSDHAAGKFDLSVSEPMLTRGQTLTLEKEDKTITYYMFATSYTRPLNAYITDMVLMAVAVGGVLLIVSAFFVLYTIHVKNRQMEQLRQSMAQYVQGDYSAPLAPERYVGTELEEIAELAETLGSQARRAEESSRQFVSNVSHELRTPMTVISGFVDGILDGTIPKNRRTEYLSIVSQEIQRLKMLVTSMLNLTKFDAGTIQLNYRMFTLNDTAFRTLLMFQNRLEKRGISVEGLDSPPVRVCADPDLIGQVVYNLVENAVKFVNDGGTITFSFADRGADGWMFAIRNTGNGIPKEELPKIFERFYKSDASRSLDKTGLGLGLDIIRRIIHLHHGEISVSSEEQVYTEFKVCLPRMEPPEAEPVTDKSEKQKSKL